MSGILEAIAQANRARVAEEARSMPLGILKACAWFGERDGGEAFEQALAKPGLSFICEVKKASPSKGIIDPDFRYLDIAREYCEAGADCISCLTEPQWFLGSDLIFSQIRERVGTPMLRKDFTVDEYQIYQAKCMGANAVLLICTITDQIDLVRYLEICDDIGLAALVEAHDEDEIKRAVAAGARIIGVNNRNLRDFTVDFENARRLRDLIPPHCLYVAESGVSCATDIEQVAAMGADAVLVGEAFMRSSDKPATLSGFRAAAERGRACRA